MSAANFKRQSPTRVPGLTAPHPNDPHNPTSLNDTATPSSSSGLVDSLQRWFELPSPEALLDELTQLAVHEKALQTRRQEILDSLDLLVEAGEAQEEMVWNDFKITRRTRKSYTYPDHITNQRDALKAAEKLSVALGEATLKLTSFWELRHPKP